MCRYTQKQKEFAILEIAIMGQEGICDSTIDYVGRDNSIIVMTQPAPWIM